MNILCVVILISYFCNAFNGWTRVKLVFMTLSLSIIVVILLPVLVVKP